MLPCIYPVLEENTVTFIFPLFPHLIVASLKIAIKAIEILKRFILNLWLFQTKNEKNNIFFLGFIMKKYLL